MVKILFGIISGIISGLGMGGGTILIVLLSQFLNIDQKIAQSSNLIFFIPTSIISTIINIKHKRIDFKISFFIILFGIMGSLIGSYIATIINTTLLRKAFSIFLFLIAVYEAFCWYKKFIKRHNNKKQERKYKI